MTPEDGGAKARVFNERGAFEAVAQLSADTQPDIAGAPLGSLVRYDAPLEPVLPAEEWQMNR